MKHQGKNVDVKIDNDAGHAFESPNNQSGYREADAADACQRTQNFIVNTLKK